MRAYGIFPLIDLADPADARVQTCISIVTELVCRALRGKGDRFHYAVDWRDPGGPEWGIFTEGLAEPHVHSLSDPEELGRLVRLAVDPFSGQGATIRSIASCRAVTFGYDGQDDIFAELLNRLDEIEVSPLGNGVVLKAK